jgi:hypothetical protein
MKIKQVQKVLQSNLKLLVLLRESLVAEGATNTPIYAAVAAQAQATGMMLPDAMRMTKEEINVIRRQAVAANLNAGNPAPADAAESSIKVPALPKSGQFQILDPSQIKRKL